MSLFESEKKWIFIGNYHIVNLLYISDFVYTYQTYPPIAVWEKRLSFKRTP